MSTADEIKVLGSLSQGAAAWLLGISPRSLRDRNTLPRNPDGTYDAREVLAWHLSDNVTGLVAKVGELLAELDE